MAHTHTHTHSTPHSFKFISIDEQNYIPKQLKIKTGKSTHRSEKNKNDDKLKPSISTVPEKLLKITIDILFIKRLRLLIIIFFLFISPLRYTLINRRPEIKCSSLVFLLFNLIFVPPFPILHSILLLLLFLLYLSAHSIN